MLNQLPIDLIDYIGVQYIYAHGSTRDVKHLLAFIGTCPSIRRTFIDSDTKSFVRSCLRDVTYSIVQGTEALVAHARAKQHLENFQSLLWILNVRTGGNNQSFLKQMGCSLRSEYDNMIDLLYRYNLRGEIACAIYDKYCEVQGSLVWAPHDLKERHEMAFVHPDIIINHIKKSKEPFHIGSLFIQHWTRLNSNFVDSPEFTINHCKIITHYRNKHKDVVDMNRLWLLVMHGHNNLWKEQQDAYIQLINDAKALAGPPIYDNIDKSLRSFWLDSFGILRFHICQNRTGLCEIGKDSYCLTGNRALRELVKAIIESPRLTINTDGRFFVGHNNIYTVFNELCLAYIAAWNPSGTNLHRVQVLMAKCTISKKHNKRDVRYHEFG